MSASPQLNRDMVLRLAVARLRATYLESALKLAGGTSCEASAPLFEEFMFRGLVYRGLASSASSRLAIPASALLFALVHPAASMIPVFGLGVGTAWAYRRTGGLMAPMIAHAFYNTVIADLNFGLY